VLDAHSAKSVKFPIKILGICQQQKRAEPTLTLPLLFDKMVPPVLRDGCSYQMAILDDMDDI